MTARDPKTGRFIKAWKLKEKEMKNKGYFTLTDLDDQLKLGQSQQDIINSLFDRQDLYVNNDLKIKVPANYIVNLTQTKTPRNYWNYFLLGVFGIICVIIGYELTQFLPIL